MNESARPTHKKKEAKMRKSKTTSAINAEYFKYRIVVQATNRQGETEISTISLFTGSYDPLDAGTRARDMYALAGWSQIIITNVLFFGVRKYHDVYAELEDRPPFS